MTPPSFYTFFAASAGVAGALIGLLFVAISVAGERLTEAGLNQAHRLRASAALTSFTNALSVALFAIVPGVGLRWPAFVVGVSGLLFIAASLLSLVRVRAHEEVALRDTLFLGALAVVFVFQIYFALRLMSNASDTGAAQGIAVLVIVCFLIGVARAWELVGGPSLNFRQEMVAAVRARAAERPTPEAEP